MQQPAALRDADTMKKRAKAAVQPAVEAKPAAPSWWPKLEAVLDRHAVWLTVALVVIATIRIASTYTIFSHTFDEPAHIACGLQWLDQHNYSYEPQHPPLARIMTALLPWISGSHSTNKKSMWDEGLAILFAPGTEDYKLTLARLGILPFFWIACWVTFACTRWISGKNSAAVLAVFLVTMTPSILAHAGLATTDMALTAMLMLAVYTGWRWIEEPVLWRSAAFGASTAGAILAKFSTLAFLPTVAAVALIIWLVLERPNPAELLPPIRRRIPQALLAVGIAVIAIWAVYLFSFGKTADFSFSVPAPQLFAGVDEVRKHNHTGHLTYLLGAINTTGWPQFYAVALAVKTPLPILALGLLGLGLLFSRARYGTRGWIAPSVALGILIFSSFFSHIRIGTRHVLPVFIAFGMAGGCAIAWLMELRRNQRLWQSVGALALGSVAIISLAAHPNYLAYFNVIAGDKPQNFLVDSDLDWGQDTKRLAQRLKELNVREIYYNQFAFGNLEKLYGFPVIHPLDVKGPHPGWNVVSLTALKYGIFGDTRYAYDPGFQFWPDQMQPNELVGSSYWLFDVESGRK